MFNRHTAVLDHQLAVLLLLLPLLLLMLVVTAAADAADDLVYASCRSCRATPPCHPRAKCQIYAEISWLPASTGTLHSDRRPQCCCSTPGSLRPAL
jgi:hypothetical protein